jgi:arylsulfatase A-like enzyme
MNAKSILPRMRGEASTHRGADEWVGYELMGNAAIFQGNYTALRLGAWLKSLGVEGAGTWKLHNIKEDPSELHDLSEQEPERLAEMVANYAEYSESLDIIGMPADFNPIAVITGN